MIAQTLRTLEALVDVQEIIVCVTLGWLSDFAAEKGGAMAAILQVLE